jgi:outer membrane protein assembly factor BamE (lipoprotein component of BamABCDE complex)
MTRLFMVVPIALTLSVGTCHESDYQQIGGRKFSVIAARRIKPGLSATQVRELLGEPSRVVALDRGEQRWVYQMELQRESSVDVFVRIPVGHARMTVTEVVVLSGQTVVSADLAFDGPR